MTEPIAFTVTRHRCPFCPRTGSSKARVREHIARCWFNPDNRGCKTCKHFVPYSPSDCDGLVLYASDEPEHCAVGVDLHRRALGAGLNEVVVDADKTWPQIHCERWELADA